MPTIDDRHHLSSFYTLALHEHDGLIGFVGEGAGAVMDGCLDEITRHGAASASSASGSVGS